MLFHFTLINEACRDPCVLCGASSIQVQDVTIETIAW